MNHKNMRNKILKIALLFIVAIFITSAWAHYVPFDGLVLGEGKYIDCGDPSGFPIAYTGTWKHLDQDERIKNNLSPVPLCIPYRGPNYISIALYLLNGIFWTGLMYIFWYLTEKIFIKVRPRHNV
ncbi:MAG: hypothetical protein WD712_00905 [Candidatus Spechtbacterales bacterium]